jgi:hypothetical protein
MMTAELMGYIVGGLLSVFGLVGAVDHDAIDSGFKLEAGYYVHNDRPRYNNRPTLLDERFNTKLAVYSKVTFYKFLDVDFGMQGFAVKNGFINAEGGAVFGLTFRIVPNMYVYYKHYSAHVFDNGNKKADAGTEDYIGVVFNFGYDKGRSSLFK